jgi:hypothetical protein
MADSKPAAPKRPLTWQEKIDAGKPLNPLDETKADADFNHQKRVRDQEEREEYEARKRGVTRENPEGNQE